MKVELRKWELRFQAAGVKESSKMESKMTKPVFENDQAGGRWTKGRETGDKEMARITDVPQSNVSGKGEGRPNLLSFALHKILICLGQKHSNLIRQEPDFPGTHT